MGNVLWRLQAYLADEVWSQVWRVAELAAHLQVADAEDGVSELGQRLGASHQQRHMRSHVVKLAGGLKSKVSSTNENTQEEKNAVKTGGTLTTLKRGDQNSLYQSSQGSRC